VNGSLNEAAKSYVRAIALVTNERERSYLERAFARWKVYNRKATPTDNDRLFGFLGWFASERVETKGRLIMTTIRPGNSRIVLTNTFFVRAGSHNRLLRVQLKSRRAKPPDSAYARHSDGLQESLSWEGVPHA
jgi:hypothetical protein